MIAMPRLPQQLAWLLLSSLACGQNTIDSLSFGNRGNLAPDNRGIPGWQSTSVNHHIQILSDRVILTPPIPGNARGALWSDATASQSEWTASLDFRASGQDMGSGNLNLWYTKDKDRVGTDSAYSAEVFDGLVLVVDQYGGSGGKIRGFLNDGSQNFRMHKSLDALAFGHCDYAYRNLGRPSTLRVSNANGLTVSVDDRLCFSSDKISLPSGYYFGITSSTGENPDSFEVSKFTVTDRGSLDSHSNSNQQQQQQQRNDPPLQKLDSFPGAPEYVPDRSADEIRTQGDQFADLHNRVQSLQHSMANLFVELKAVSEKVERAQAEVLQGMRNVQGSRETGLPPEMVGTISAMSAKMDRLERSMESVQREVSGKDYARHLNELNSAVDRIHAGLTAELPDRILGIVSRHKPSIGVFVFLAVAAQVALVGGYMLYRRRRDSMPKKFL